MQQIDFGMSDIFASSWMNTSAYANWMQCASYMPYCASPDLSIQCDFNNYCWCSEECSVEDKRKHSTSYDSCATMASGLGLSLPAKIHKVKSRKRKSEFPLLDDKISDLIEKVSSGAIS
mmetsp:Transcript_25038/g.28772  ORF Transcript_25038/g.28772 Transcript_25038/m.28772 type:complete len:119 (+) Transcript_25038:88-444(+)